MKFKSGDRVVLLDNSYSGSRWPDDFMHPGRTGTVAHIEIVNGAPLVYVRLDEHPDNYSSPNTGFGDDLWPMRLNEIALLD